MLTTIRRFVTRLAGALDPEVTEAELAQAEWEDWLAAHPFVSEYITSPLDAA